MRRARTGFTLIELLVVISIIAILISILLPALSGAKKRGQQVVCSSNLRQMGIGLTDYIQNNEGYYPGDHREDGQGSHIMWNQRLRNLWDGESDVFRCPTNKAAIDWKGERMNGDEFFSYGYNGWGVRDFTNPHLGLGGHTGHPLYGELHESRLKRPDDMIAIGDSFSDGFWDAWLTPQSNFPASWPSKRHYEGSQILFCDLSIEHATQKELVVRTDSAMMRWNNDHKPHPEHW